MAALDSLTYKQTLNSDWTAGVNFTGFGNPNQNQNQHNKSSIYAKTLANTVSFGTDQAMVSVVTITSGSTAQIDLMSFTDLQNRSAQTFARIKSYKFRLLSDSETTPDGLITGTTCTQVKIGSAQTSACPLNFGSTQVQLTLNKGSVLAYADGSANGMAVTNTQRTIAIANPDANTNAVMLVEFAGCTN